MKEIIFIVRPHFAGGGGVGEELCNYFNLSYFGTLKDLKSRRSDFNKERKMNQLSVDGDPKKKHFIID